MRGAPGNGQVGTKEERGTHGPDQAEEVIGLAKRKRHKARRKSSGGGLLSNFDNGHRGASIISKI